MSPPHTQDGPASKAKGNGFCSSRRNFLLAGASTVILSSIPGISFAVEAQVKGYEKLKIASLSALKDDECITFHYPEDTAYCINNLYKLGEEAGKGVGPQKDIVAFSGYCTHMGGPLTGFYNKQHKVAGPCPLHLTTFDLTRHGMVVSGHATQSLPQILLEIEGDDIFAVGVLGLVYGLNDNDFIKTVNI